MQAVDGSKAVNAKMTTQTLRVDYNCVDFRCKLARGVGTLAYRSNPITQSCLEQHSTKSEPQLGHPRRCTQPPWGICGKNNAALTLAEPGSSRISTPSPTTRPASKVFFTKSKIRFENKHNQWKRSQPRGTAHALMD